MESVSILGVSWADTTAVLAGAAAVAHLAFQWVVHVVVYPGLADQARAAGASAPEMHARYTSRMAVAVAPVYGLLVVGVGAAVAASPGWRTGAAAGLVVAVLALTAAGAVPVHRSLSGPAAQGRVAALHRRLVLVDRWRLILAVVLVVLLAGR